MSIRQGCFCFTETENTFMVQNRGKIARDNELLSIWNDVKALWSQRIFAVGISCSMILSYLTLLLHPTIGIDDTSFKLYYVDGVAPAMGRWCCYLMNKVIPLNYNPHFVEAVGLCFFCLSVTLWCVVFLRMFGGELSVGAYAAFGAVMISSPILSEVVIWYLQDGIYLGYGFTALAVLFALKMLRGGVLGRTSGNPCAVVLYVDDSNRIL